MNAFEEMSKQPLTGVDEEDDMLLFETGVYSFYGNTPQFELSLVRQFPCEENDEYYQLHMVVLYEPSENNRRFVVTKWSDAVDGNFFDFIRSTEVFCVAKSERIVDVVVYLDET